MTVGIYLITSPTNKVYVGQSWDIEKRWNDYKKINCKSQAKIYYSIRKYGWQAHKFEILFELREDTTQEWLDYWEIFFWQYYKDCGYELLNLKKPGSHGKHSKKTKEKLSEIGKTLVGEKNPMFGKTHTPETRKKISENLTGKYQGDKNPNYGRKHSVEIRTKMSISAKGRKVTQETKDKLSKALTGKRVGDKHPMWGKNHSEESKKKTSESLKRIGHKPPDDCRTGVKNGNFRGMILVWRDDNLVKEFESIKAASKFTTVHPSNISKVLNGGKCSALQGYTFTREPLQK